MATTNKNDLIAKIVDKNTTEPKEEAKGDWALVTNASAPQQLQTPLLSSPISNEKAVFKSPVNNAQAEKAERRSGVVTSGINTPPDGGPGSRNQSSSIGVDASSQEMITPSVSSPDLTRNRNSS